MLRWRPAIQKLWRSPVKVYYKRGGNGYSIAIKDVGLIVILPSFYKKIRRKGENHQCNHTNRVSVSTPLAMKGGDGMCKRRKSGSLTVEAALILPLFLFAALSILYINKLILYEEKVQWALNRAAREASVEYAAFKNPVTINPLFLSGKVNGYMKEDGLSVRLLRSRFDKESDEWKLIADCQVMIPFPIAAVRRVNFTEQVSTRAFTGVETRLETGCAEDDATVYIAKTGTVYHRRLSCPYLTLSISEVKYGDLEYVRGADGGKYYACEACSKGVVFRPGENVLICNYGDRFHTSRACKNIRRSIQEISISEVGGRLPCSKCGKEQ